MPVPTSPSLPSPIASAAAAFEERLASIHRYLIILCRTGLEPSSSSERLPSSASLRSSATAGWPSAASPSLSLSSTSSLSQACLPPTKVRSWITWLGTPVIPKMLVSGESLPSTAQGILVSGRLLRETLLMSFGEVSSQVLSRRELLRAFRALEVFALLVLVQDDLVVEGFVAEVAERLHVCKVSLPSPHFRLTE